MSLKSKSAVVQVSRNRCELVEGPITLVNEACTFLDPRRQKSYAFQNGDWDGYHRMSIDRVFPLGFIERVQKVAVKRGFDLTIRGREGSHIGNPILPADVPADYLDTITLRDEQREAVALMFNASHGRTGLPTGVGKTAVIAALAKMLYERHGFVSLVITSGKKIADQNAKAFRTYVGDLIDIGEFYTGRRRMGAIISATDDTAMMGVPKMQLEEGTNIWKEVRPANPTVAAMLALVDVLIFDEGHHCAAATWGGLANAVDAKRRYALSGTIETKNMGRDLLIRACTGPLLYKRNTAEMVGIGRVAKPLIAMVHSPAASHPPVRMNVTRADALIKWKVLNDKAAAKSREFNGEVLDGVVWLLRRKRRVLLLCQLRTQWLLLRDMMRERSIGFACVWGDTPDLMRDKRIERFASRGVNVLLSSSVLDEGADIPTIDAVVLPDPRTSYVKLIQRIGRGLRLLGDGPGTVWVVDHWQTCHGMFVRQGNTRAEHYEEEGYEAVKWKRWKKDSLLLPFENWDQIYARLGQAQPVVLRRKPPTN